MKNLLWFFLFLLGCSSTAMLNRIQTSTTYPNKLPLKAAVYLTQEIYERKVTTSPSTMTCSAWKAEVDVGEGYLTAILNGLSAALAKVDLVKTMPTPEFARNNGYDIVVNVNLINENLGITVNEGFWSNTVNTQFQVSFNLSFIDNQGNALYSYTANGNGFNNTTGSCSELAASSKISMETALHQIADNIATATYSGLKK